MEVKLSDGTKVTLKDVWTHGVQKQFNQGLFGEGTDVTAKGLLAAWEAVFPLLVTKIEKNAAAVEYSTAWLDGLDERDYKLIRDAADDLTADDAGSKKNP